MALIATMTDVPVAMSLLAAASIVGGLLIFTTHGGKKVTAAGVYCLTSGVMTGGGCWYWARQDLTGTDRLSVLVASLTIYAATAAMYVFFWRTSLIDTVTAEPRPPLNSQWAQNIAIVGLAVFVIGAIAKESGLTLGTLAQSTAEVGAITFGASLLLSGGVRMLHSPAQAAAIGVMLVVFYDAVFTGGGRLRLVTVVIALAVVAQYRLKTPVKLIALMAMVPTILFFASIGQARVADQATNPNYQASASGLGSLVNPLATYAQLIDQQVTGGHGSTLVAEAVVLVPRSLWPNKPVQFGQVLVQRLHPEASSTSNLSIPALDEGEWFYNFSWLGLLLMVVVTGPLLRFIDRRVQRRRSFTHPAQVFTFVSLAILVGSISDLAWGGLSTWEVRNVQRLLVLLPMLACSYLLTTRAPTVGSDSTA